MRTKIEEFEVLVPDVEGTGIVERIKVPITLRWDEDVKEWLLTAEAHRVLEETRPRHVTWASCYLINSRNCASVTGIRSARWASYFRWARKAGRVGRAVS